MNLCPDGAPNRRPESVSWRGGAGARPVEAQSKPALSALASSGEQEPDAGQLSRRVKHRDAPAHFGEGGLEKVTRKQRRVVWRAKKLPKLVDGRGIRAIGAIKEARVE